MTTLRVQRLKRHDNGERSILVEIDGKNQWLTGPLPPIKAGQFLRVEYQGQRLIKAERVVTKDEINRGFYGRLKGFERDSAMKILTLLGEDAHELITDPARLSGRTDLPASGLKAMKNHARRNGRLWRSIMELAEMGIGPEDAGGLLYEHGAGAARFFKENPYAAITHMPLQVIDHAAQRLGVSLFDPRRWPALALETVKEACQEMGHTCVPLETLRQLLQDTHALDEEESRQAIGGALALDHLKEEHQAAFLPRQYRTERWLADDLVRLHLSRPEPVTPLHAEHLTDEQQYAVRLGCERALSIITGGPGTGKTTTLKVLLDSLEAGGLRPVLCAPTGKAASRMTQSTGREATTLHRMLGYDGHKFASAMLEGDAFVVDEVSMASNDLLGALVRYVPEGKRVILVGDEDQLPPIDPGHPLAALVRTLPLARLTKTHRQAEGSPILKLAHMLIGGEVPAYTGVPFEGADNATGIVQLVQKVEQGTGQRPMVLTAGRAGSLGVGSLNKALQAALNPGDTIFRLGDPVMMTRNDHDRGLMNGMTGTIVSLGNKQVVCDFEGKLHKLPAGYVNFFDLAYAMTIHRSQGSEWGEVIVALSEQHERLLSRQLAYTAVTRAKQGLIASGARSAWKRSALTGFPERYSRLERMLRE